MNQTGKHACDCMWHLWLSGTALIALGSLGLWAVLGQAGAAKLIQPGPLSVLQQTLACTVSAWLAWGVGLFFLKNPQVRKRSGAEIVCALLVLLLYLNFLRERVHYADVGDYVRAALDLQAGRPFHGRYLYPPLLATLCQPLLPLGEQGVAAVIWLSNLAALVVFFWLLVRTLSRYGFQRVPALFAVFVFLTVNVPLLRTLAYVQINLHVINLILISAIVYPRQRILSALALALAVHLKVTPLVVALPFFWSRDLRWIAAFVAGLCGLAGLTVCFFGWGPFESFLSNAGSIYSANGICFRDNSLDSLIRATGSLLGVDATPAVLWVKLPCLAALAWATLRALSKGAWAPSEGKTENVLNSLPALLVLMALASPLVWEHHFVFLSVPFLVAVKKIDSPQASALYSFAYLCTFLIPTFDVYPWSYGRLLGAALLGVLLYRLAARPDAPWFVSWQSRMAALCGVAAKGR